MIWKKRPAKSECSGERGSVILEAAVVMPMIVLMIGGIADYGLFLYQYHVLSQATGEAVRQLIISRGFDDPYSTTTAPYGTWYSKFSSNGNQFKILVADSNDVLQPCTDKATCKAKLDLAAGKKAGIELTYNCTMSFIPKLGNPCPITIKNYGMVE